MCSFFLFTTLDTIGKELEVRSEPEEHQDQDQGHFAKPGKPPQHPIELLLFVQSMFCFQNKIMHVLFLLWHFVTQNYFIKYCLAKDIY